MYLLILAMVILTVFLAGVFVIAKILVVKHGDGTATYQLYAVRDQIVGMVAFDGVSRQDPWLNSTYENVNYVLRASNLLGSPRNWGLARAIGRHIAHHPKGPPIMVPFPDGEPPEYMTPVFRNLVPALTRLSEEHRGFLIMVNTERREKRRIQREKANDLLELVRSQPELSICR